MKYLRNHVFHNVASFDRYTTMTTQTLLCSTVASTERHCPREDARELDEMEERVRALENITQVDTPGAFPQGAELCVTFSRARKGSPPTVRTHTHTHTHMRFTRTPFAILCHHHPPVGRDRNPASNLIVRTKAGRIDDDDDTEVRLRLRVNV